VPAPQQTSTTTAALTASPSRPAWGIDR
jgi:hypothetical protein